MANFTVVDWSTLSEITSTKMHQMMDNDQYLKDAIAGINTTLGRAVITSDTSSFTGTSDNAISGLSVTVSSLAASRLVKVTFCWRAVNISSGNPEVFGMRVKMDGTVIGEANVYVNVIGAGMGGGTVIGLATPASGNHTFTASFKAQTGAGATFNLQANSGYPAMIIVEDAGPA